MLAKPEPLVNEISYPVGAVIVMSPFRLVAEALNVCSVEAVPEQVVNDKLF